MKKFPYYRQADSMDCGPTCLRMIARHYGKEFPIHVLREKCAIDREGVSLLSISTAAEDIGFRTLAVKVPFDDPEHPSLQKAPLPCIAFWKREHFVVVYKMNKKYVWISDPGNGRHKLSHQAFEQSWLMESNKGIALLLESTPAFQQTEQDQSREGGMRFLLKYLIPYRSFYIQLLLGLLLGIVFQLLFPFLTQALVDVGIQDSNLNFILLILFAQLILFLSQTFVQFLQSWIILHLSTRINVAIISDFLIKLMNLPLSYFDSKNLGDLLQRIGDHKRIESFLTVSTLRAFFSFFSMIVFSFILYLYNPFVFLIFFSGAILYIGWILFFLERRKKVDYLAFQQESANNGALVEIIQGMSEIKLQNSETKRRWNWAHIQARLFSAHIKSMTITQFQDTGGAFINQLKDILITYFVAKAVVEGQMSLGMMMAVQYIAGQLNAPLVQLIGFVRTAQDANISLERLREIHRSPTENAESHKPIRQLSSGDILLKDLSFRYSSLGNEILQQINLRLPYGKTTAIVGLSGSGKTTLIKILLGFYLPTEGQIFVGGDELPQIDQRVWRANCGVVLQDGFLFSDTIANNITESDQSVDKEKLLHAVKLANAQSFIEELPLRYNTMIGPNGMGISQGQRQRILIARAIYKNPSILFFDEATNALDTFNERIIVNNLTEYFENKTVVVIAHRLSTVQHADKIVVLEQGRIVEEGTHSDLLALQGHYVKLIKNQLEIGG
ncbi:MAG: peptidase domain-containing ABC transporter [Bacteroidota bacterium]